jgi:GAF domain-containing protein
VRRPGTTSRNPSKTRHRKPTRPKRRNVPTAARRGSPSLADLQEQISALASELAESRDQQAATSEVLRLISSSPGELEPVFEAMLENAIRLCEAKFGMLWIAESDGFRSVALHGVPPELAETRQADGVVHFRPEVPFGRLIDTNRLVHIADLTREPGYITGFKPLVDLVDIGGARTLLLVPMLKGSELIGAFAIYRTEVRPFIDKQIALVENFAAQAVIAIENARLLNELRESLQQQTATADVLKVISRSTFDLQAVLDMLIESAVRLCEADMGSINRQHGESFQQVADYGHSPALQAYMDTHPIPAGRASVVGRCMLEKRVVQIPDIEADVEYAFGEGAKLAGLRTMLGVPLLRDGIPIGVAVMQRRAVRPFTDNQVALVKTFADQAVIAIENARLLNELRESLQQQTATADVLKVISRSTFDLQAVLDTLVESAAQLCRSDWAVIRLAKDGLYHHVASRGLTPEHKARMEREPVKVDQSSTVGRVVLAGKSVHIVDSQADPNPVLASRSRSGKIRTMLGVPLRREGKPIGVLLLQRTVVEPFSEKEIALAETFADQAVIAIENVRLFEAEQQRTRELSESLERQTATSDVLRVISSSPSELQPVFDTIIRNARRLCGARFAVLHRFDGEMLHLAAHDVTPEVLEILRRAYPMRPSRSQASGRALLTRAVAAIHDVQDDPDYQHDMARAGQWRSLLAVPMIRADGEAMGTIVVQWTEPGPFAPRHVEMLKTFADQAVIAIENARLLNDLRQRTADLTESLELQTATSKVLEVISSSPGELEPTFNAMLESAARICEATNATILLRDGDLMVTRAAFGPRRTVIGPRTPLSRDWVVGRAILERRTINVPDLTNNDDFPQGGESGRRYGVRAILAVPLVREGAAIGAIALHRPEARAFAPKQVELVTNFAAQAVIAIENARLLNELRESLQQQTATADVLKVISRSTFDLQTVLNTLIETAARLCDAPRGIIFRREGDSYHGVAFYNISPELIDFIKRHPIDPSGRHTVTARVALERRMVHVADLQADVEYEYALRDVDPIRTELGVPMFREADIVGIIILYKFEVEPFTDKQIDLVTTFADQAAIAIENARLLNELRQRTADLTESLEQQTATSEVLRVISSSPGELQPVFQSMLANAVRLCDANVGILWQREHDAFRRIAMHGVPAELVGRLPAESWRPSPESKLAQMQKTKEIVRVADARLTPAYVSGEPWPVAAADLLGERTFLVVPMLKEGELIGALQIFRQDVRPFDPKHVALVQNFASQAVIAIENARLLNELRTRTDDLARSVGELRALGEVGQAVNSTLEVETVLRTIVTKAVELSATDAGAIYVFDDERREFRLRATYGMSEAMIAAISDRHIGTGDANIGEAARRREPIQLADLRHTPASALKDIVLDAGYRALLVVPLLRPDRVVGVLVVRRRQPGEFPQSAVDLLETFADQSVLAIQNARLFREIDEKGRQLEVASKHKSQFLANMSHELRTPLNAILGYTELILDNIYGEAPARVRGVLERVQSNGKHLLGLINDVLDLSKIEAGQLTLSLVDYALDEVVKGVYAAVEPLAVEKKLAFKLALPDHLPRGHGDDRRISQVLLNLVGNAIKFTDAGEVEITAAAENGDFTVAVRDTGPGISPEDQAKIFEEFRQADDSSTRKKGGSGLGLSIAKRIVEMHGGRIWVNSAPGAGSTFAFTLPVTVERQASDVRDQMSDVR